MLALFSHLIHSVKLFKNKTLEKVSSLLMQPGTTICKTNRTAFKAVADSVLDFQWSNYNEVCTTDNQGGRLPSSTAPSCHFTSPQLLHPRKNCPRDGQSLSYTCHMSVVLCWPVHEEQRTLALFSSSLPTAVGEDKESSISSTIHFSFTQ